MSSSTDWLSVTGGIVGAIGGPAGSGSGCGSGCGKPLAFDRETYKHRNTVEQRVNGLKRR